MSALVHLYESAMNATMDLSRGDVSSAEVWEYRMLTIARSAHSRRKIEMGALKLSIWVALKLICFMNARSMGLKNADMAEGTFSISVFSFRFSKKLFGDEKINL